MRVSLGDRVRLKNDVGELKKGDEFTVVDYYRLGSKAFVVDHRPMIPVKISANDLEKVR